MTFYYVETFCFHCVAHKGVSVGFFVWRICTIIPNYAHALYYIQSAQIGNSNCTALDLRKQTRRFSLTCSWEVHLYGTPYYHSRQVLRQLGERTERVCAFAMLRPWSLWNSASLACTISQPDCPFVQASEYRIVTTEFVIHFKFPQVCWSEEADEYRLWDTLHKGLE